MKLFNAFGPNPRLMRMFLIEKGIEIPFQDIDTIAGENRKPPYTEKNPGEQVPALELDDGSVIGETVTICEYLEELNPTPVLIGSTPEERANTSQWQRRVELKITEHVLNGFRYAEGLQLFKDRMRCLPDSAADLKQVGRDGLAWLDGQIAGRPFISGDALRLPDIFLFGILDFAQTVGQPLDPTHKNLSDWFTRMDARPSAKQSLHPAHEKIGMHG